MSTPDGWAAGGAVEVWSASLSRWIPGNVIDSNFDGSVCVQYGPALPDLPQQRTKWLGPSAVAFSLRRAGDADGLDAGSKLSLFAVCSNGHELDYFPAPLDGYSCDVCGKSLPKGTLLWGCRLCDWDTCASCRVKSSSSNANAGCAGGRLARKPALCPQGHPTYSFQATREGYSCDVCAQKFPKETTLWGCRICDWDVCMTCRRKCAEKQFDGHLAIGSRDACPAGHTLKTTRSPTEGYRCDVCYAELPSGSKLWCCRECDWDRCERCGRSVGCFAEGPEYAAGDRIEVWSVSCSRWFQGEVLALRPDGGIYVNYGPSLPELPAARQKWIEPAALAHELRLLSSTSTSMPSGPAKASAPDMSPAAVEAAAGSVAALRRHFQELDTDGSGHVSAQELAKSLADAAEDRKGSSLSLAEREAIAANVQQRFKLLDVDRDGKISVDEWLHECLLDKRSPGSAARDAISACLRQKGPARLAQLVRAWESIDTDGDGVLTQQELRQARLCDDGETKKLLAAMDADGSGDVSYAEYCAAELGLPFEPVVLYYYDISDGIAKYLGPLLVWQRFEGVWHTGVVVYNSEYYYGGGVWEDPPGETPFGAPTKKLKLGLTLRRKEELDNLCAEKLEDEFNEDNYDVLDHNCNCFSDAVTMFLLGQHIPDQVRMQPIKVRRSPVVRAIRPLLNRWLGRVEGSQKAGHEDNVNGSFYRLPSKNGDRRYSKTSISASTTAKLRNSGSGRFVTPWTLGDAARREGGELVVYRPPVGPNEESKPVVANVRKSYYQHGVEVVDLTWFDAAGVSQTANAVVRIDVDPYVHQAGDEKEVYFAVLLALEAEAEASRAAAAGKEKDGASGAVAVAAPDGAAAIRRQLGRSLAAQRPQNIMQAGLRIKQEAAAPRIGRAILADGFVGA